jgi:transposase-like protein
LTNTEDAVIVQILSKTDISFSEGGQELQKRPKFVQKGNTTEDQLLQKLLPLFSTDVTLINSLIGFSKRDNQVYYFNGQMPLFFHAEDDMESFKMFMAQLYVQGNVKQSEINRVFKLNAINMKRWVQKFKEGGPGAFYKKESSSKARRNSVLTEEVIKKVQSLLDEGYGVSKIGKELNLKADTLRKAISSGKLHRITVKDKEELKKKQKISV